jgi:hemerythrin-like metal-binding protein
VALQWTPAISVGIEQVDREHRAFFALANQLSAALAAGLGQAELSGLVILLRICAKQHFQHEKEEMLGYGYPDTASHLVEHDDAYAMLVEFEEAVERGSQLVTVEASEVLSAWLVDHVTRADMKFGAWLAGRRLAADAGLASTVGAVR